MNSLAIYVLSAMYYKKRPTILFRRYKDFGYLTDNRNFGYRKPGTSVFGDKVLSISGAEMIQCLGKESLTPEVVARRVMKQFSGVEYQEVLHDVVELFDSLVDDGFLVKETCSEDCDSKALTKDFYQPYSNSSEPTSPELQVGKSTQEFLQNHYGDTPFPMSVHIEIVRACNERCIHCYIPAEYKTGLMPLAQFEEIVRQCMEMNILHLTLSGGEPLLHPDIIRMLSLCRQNDFSVNVLSNATLLSDEIIEEMESNPLLGVQVSLYSTDCTIHDSITGMAGSCDKTKSAILKLIQHGIPVQISCPIMQQNCEFYGDVVEWGDKIGVSVSADYVIIGRCDSSSANLGCRLHIDNIASIIRDEMRNPSYRGKEAEEVRKNRLRTGEDYICSVCTSSICIGVTGDVFPCAGWHGCELGNLHETSLKEIWYHSEKAKWLRSLKRKDMEGCDGCKHSDYCTLCLVRNANESATGNPLEANRFFCEVAKIKERILKESDY